MCRSAWVADMTKMVKSPKNYAGAGIDDHLLLTQYAPRRPQSRDRSIQQCPIGNGMPATSPQQNSVPRPDYAAFLREQAAH